MQLKPNQKENLILQLGQKYTVSIFTGRGFSKTSVTLTDKTLSGVGKQLGQTSSLISFKANLSHVSSLALIYQSSLVLLLLGIITSILSLFLVLFGIMPLPFFGIGLISSKISTAPEDESFLNILNKL